MSYFPENSEKVVLVCTVFFLYTIRKNFRLKYACKYILFILIYHNKFRQKFIFLRRSSRGVIIACANSIAMYCLILVVFIVCSHIFLHIVAFARNLQRFRVEFFKPLFFFSFFCVNHLPVRCICFRILTIYFSMAVCFF